MQVTEEDVKSTDECLDHLALNDPKSVARTDAGSGWPYPIKDVRNQVHTEDPNHLHRNAVEIASKSHTPDQFIVDVGGAL